MGKMALSHGIPRLDRKVRRTSATTLPCRDTQRFHQEEELIYQVMRGSEYIRVLTDQVMFNVQA
jgi:hypothetical protein